MRWRLYIEEYSPDLQCIKGEKNADALSRLDMDEKPSLHKALITDEMCSDWYCYAQEEKTFDSHPLSFQKLEKAQDADKSLIETCFRKTCLIKSILFMGGGGGITRELIYKNTKIVFPTLLQKHVIDWYHTVLCHPGINQTEETIAQHLWWPQMREQIASYV